MNNNKKRSQKNLPTTESKAKVEKIEKIEKIENLENLGALQESEAKYRGFIENLPVMFYAAEPVPPFAPLYISPAFETFGYPLEEWRASKDLWLRVLHDDDRERVLREAEAGMKLGETDLEYRMVGKDGSVRWVRDRGCFIKDENGKTICWQGIILNINERKKAEESLKESEARYRTLFENANDLIYVHDLKGKYLSINEAAVRVFGYPREEALAMNINQIIAPEHRKIAKRMLAKKIAGGAKQTAYEVDCITKNGERLTLEINSSAIYKDGAPIAIQGIARDITERKRAENALQNSEAELRALFAAMTDVIFVIDREGRYLKIAPTNPSLLYKPADELIGKTLHETFTESQADYFLWGVREALAKRDAVRLEYILNVNDRDVFFTAIISPMMEDSVVFVARDITERKLAEKALRQSEEQYRDLFEKANDLIYTHDLKGNFTSLNRAGERITGFSREEALKMNLAQVVAPEFLAEARERTMRKLAGELPTAYELEIIAKDGHRVSLELSTRLIFQNEQPVGVQGIGRDITARKLAERSMHKTVSLLTSTLESTADGILVINSEGKIVIYNEKFLEMWRIPAKIIEQGDDEKLVEFVQKQVSEPKKFAATIKNLYAQPQATSFDILEFKDGRLYERYSQPHIREGEPVGRVWSFRDITERRRAEEKLMHYALHDTLTNLPNRAHFMNHLKTAIERAEGNAFSRFAVLFLDLDRFKVINDSLGHVIGDKLLVAIAERLKSCVRPGDVVARLGGDEFTILLNRTGEVEDVARVAERLQKKLSEPFKLDNYEVFTSASIGIIVSDEVTRQPDDFLRDADAAMYRAKEAGKARYEIFDSEMHVRNMNVLKVETDLRHAVERGEFEVFYQPIVSLETGAIREFEALIRWRHPEHGLVAPNEFICAAEETGLIIPIGRWILEEACRQTSEWQKRFPALENLSISVNLSAKQLMHPALVAQIVEVLDQTELNPLCLKLEVTESTVMEHSETALGVLSELRELGISLSTDDFGTGYSSLSYLHRFPFERLKIDRSFINKMDLDDKSEAIARTILLLGQNLNIETVAEGIETEKQLEILRLHGCPFGQGYLFSKPVNAENAERLLREGLPFEINSIFTYGDAPQSRIMEISEIH
jgi:diguanylate cyclase (GGDEF)-like protein/PAS domain S-box-containing protein